MPRINLLPWRDQQRRERKLAFFIALGVAAGEVVHHPPGDLAVGAGPLGRVDVDAAEDRGLALVEEGVVEGLVGGDLFLMPAKVAAKRTAPAVSSGSDSTA